MKIVSFNANGIRAAARKGFFDWMEKTQPDIVCIQELKAQAWQLDSEPFHPPGYHVHFHEAEKKGYSGVAIYSKEKPDKVHIGLGEDFEDIDTEGRYIEARFGKLSVVSLYMQALGGLSLHAVRLGQGRTPADQVQLHGPLHAPAEEIPQAQTGIHHLR